MDKFSEIVHPITSLCCCHLGILRFWTDYSEYSSLFRNTKRFKGLRWLWLA